MPARPGPTAFSAGAEVGAETLTRWVPGLVPAGPPRRLEAVLLDTFDGRLARRGLTLWRVGPSRRATYHLDGHPTPLAASVPPGRRRGSLRAEDLGGGVAAARVAAAIGERALLPRVKVRRRLIPLRVLDAEGKTVVRLCLDHPAVLVSGRAPVELGGRLEVQPVLGYGADARRVVAALGRRLRPAGADLAAAALAAAGLDPAGTSPVVDVTLDPATAAGEATARICRRLAEVVEANRPGALDDLDPEFLHDLRVAIRRSRSVVKEMKDVLPPRHVDAARRGLRWVQEVTGPTRDLDVLLASWPAMAEPVPAGLAPDLAPLVALLRRHRAEAFERMRRQLSGSTWARTWSAWLGVIDGPLDGPAARRPIGPLASRRVTAVYRAMVAMGEAITDASPPEALHDLRKKGKELRYLLELFASLWPAEVVAPLVASLKGLQDELGHFQDDEIQVRELRALGPALSGQPGGTDALIALGFVIEGLVARQRQARAEFSARFAVFSSPATRRSVRQLRDRP
jgi:CHAD domain-containing protein